LTEAAAQIKVTLKRSAHITENKPIEHTKTHLTTTDCIYAQSILHQTLIAHTLILLTPKALQTSCNPTNPKSCPNTQDKLLHDC